jgi:putative oxidoreductase|tara:strand:- start:208 stop:594 length:387 start_codon:yes stop_codon:yes gene_type:complete
MINFLDLIGRIMISAIFLFSGINKILNYDGTVGWMEGYGIPGMLLIPAIIIEIIFPIFIIVGYQTRIAASGLLLFSLLTAFIFHLDFGNQMQVIAFLKNIGLAGGMLFLIINGTKDFSFEKKKKYVRL